MNRKKKIKSILMAKKKKANKKLHNSNKPKYISKAEREEMAEIKQRPAELENLNSEDQDVNS
ncbi:DUF2986 domain-containing protein [Thalassotalea sp. PS06]|uniref:DUF2986 domain-containing protein n=1 Tax=Thalassotalea sp. PS06 TaxID=2594005 RepID=UPI00116560B4|nr:DUF2986 domain-containing protein [Thalassotalea sp. PS06]QDP00786.1 DUF2986 domain-containing protein [Thalassotalea sp. PS06]